MAAEDKDEIISEIRVLRRFVGWAAGVLAAALLVAISDHFEQNRMHEDIEIMKPRVERLWYRAFPSSDHGDAGGDVADSNR